MFERSGKPKIFIGSSSQQKGIADLLKTKLANYAEAKVWDETFPLSEGTLESLVNSIGEVDFGIFVLSDDDVIEIKKQRFKISRDNVIFESGMSIGTLGRERTFLVAPIKEREFRLPSDLLGFTVAQYEKDLYETTPSEALDPAVTQIVYGIDRSRWANLKLSIKTSILINNRQDIVHKWKLWMEFKNNEHSTITCYSKEFRPNNFSIADGHATYKPSFFHFEDSKTGRHIRKEIISLMPEESTNCYVPLDADEAIRVSKRNMLRIDCGIFSLDCVVGNDNKNLFRYQASIISEGYNNNSELAFLEANMQGKWVNSWGKNGREEVFIDRDMQYFINGAANPDFTIRFFTIEEQNNIRFIKKGFDSRPDFDNRLTLIDKNTLIGVEHLVSGGSHEIRYIRKI